MKAHHIILILLFLGLSFAVDINNCQAMSEAGGSSTVGIAAAESTVATGESEVPWYIIWLPVLKLHFNVWILIAIGFSLGVLGRFFGVGGICFLTPALNVFGFPIPTAIGTDLAQMTVKACIRLAKGGWRAQVEIKLVVLMIIGMVAGIELGARTVIWLADVE